MSCCFVFTYFKKTTTENRNWHSVTYLKAVSYWSLCTMCCSSVRLLGVSLIHCFQLLHSTPWCHGVLFLPSLPVMGPLRCLPLPTIANDTAVTVLVRVPLRSWGCENSLESHAQKWDLPQWQRTTLRNAVPVLPPTSRAPGLLFPHSLANTWHHPAL